MFPHVLYWSTFADATGFVRCGPSVHAVYLISLGSWLTLWIAGVSVLVTLPLVDMVETPFSCMLHQHTLKIMITSLSGCVLRVPANTTHRGTCLFHPLW